MAKEPSKYQSAIYKEFKDTNNNIFVSAGPGCGKSHTLLEMLRMVKMDKKALMTAFNKSIAEELSEKAPKGIDVSTIHSLGYKILRKNIYGQFKLNEIKSFILAKKVIENPFKGLKNDYKRYTIYLFTISKLYDLYRFNLARNNEESLLVLAEEYSVELTGSNILSDTIKAIDYIEEYNDRKHKEMMIDFTDMLWLPYKLVDESVFPKYDVVFIDEVQDLSPLQREMILQVIKNSGRFVAVGDEKQAIYSFMGSNLDSLNTLKNKPNTTVLPLSISYRFGIGIAEYANKIFPGLEAFEENPEGIIREGSIDEAVPGDYIICRNNMPLIEVFLNLLTINKKSVIMGKDFGKNLVDLVESVESFEEFKVMLDEKYEALHHRGVLEPLKHKSYGDLLEKIDIIKLVSIKKNYTLQEVSELFRSIFLDKSKDNIIKLSTIHKSKGLQARRIFWVNPELIPSKYAKTELEFYQETCLKYVCATRCQEELIICKI